MQDVGRPTARQKIISGWASRARFRARNSGQSSPNRMLQCPRAVGPQVLRVKTARGPAVKAY